jgi:hypothetical protein
MAGVTAMFHLISNGDGTFSEPGSDAVWVLDTYTEPRESLAECDECHDEIGDWALWTCMDGGEAVHTGCVRIDV